MNEPGDVRASYVSLPEGIYLGESPAWAIHEFQTVHHAFDEAVDEDPLFPNRVGWVTWAFGHATQFQTNVYIHLYAAGNLNFLMLILFSGDHHVPDDSQGIVPTTANNSKLSWRLEGLSLYL